MQRHTFKCNDAKHVLLDVKQKLYAKEEKRQIKNNIWFEEWNFDQDKDSIVKKKQKHSK